MRVFYSWQSDLPNSTSRGLIEQALEEATKRIRSDGSIRVDQYWTATRLTFREVGNHSDDLREDRLSCGVRGGCKGGICER